VAASARPPDQAGGQAREHDSGQVDDSGERTGRARGARGQGHGAWVRRDCLQQEQPPADRRRQRADDDTPYFLTTLREQIRQKPQFREAMPTESYGNFGLMGVHLASTSVRAARRA
jgi:hypothetical protein